MGPGLERAGLFAGLLGGRAFSTKQTALGLLAPFALCALVVRGRSSIQARDSRRGSRCRYVTGRSSAGRFRGATMTISELPNEYSTRRDVSFRGADGITLRGDVWGASERPDVLLLHGGGQTRHSWTETARRLAQAGWHAVSLDLRGHGESDWSPVGDYDWDAFVRDLHCVLEQFHGLPAVVGASLGGLTALMAEGESESSVMSAVVLVDITPRFERDGVHRIIQFMTGRPDGFASVEEAAAAVAAYNPHRRRSPDRSGLLKNLRRGDDGRFRWHWDPRFLTSSGVQANDYTPDGNRLRAAAAALTIPTLLVRGGSSDVVSEEGAREFLETVPAAQYVDVSGAGHMVAGDRNDIFSQSVIDFFGSLHPKAAVRRGRA
jgi:non-heme chloroperoxidase